VDLLKLSNPPMGEIKILGFGLPAEAPGLRSPAFPRGGVGLAQAGIYSLGFKSIFLGFGAWLLGFD
jgi:hypothetical protein